jgi:hypothetical protein
VLGSIVSQILCFLCQLAATARSLPFFFFVIFRPALQASGTLVEAANSALLEIRDAAVGSLHHLPPSALFESSRPMSLEALC